MCNRRSINLFLFIALALLTVVSSCQKDDGVKDASLIKSGSADSANVSAMVMSPGNMLASSGTLSVTVEDSTYIFDAATDSIAFINVHTDDNTRYYGITAINKAHSLSFGISSLGIPVSNISNSVAGSQLIVGGGKFADIQYSLSKFSDQADPGAINLLQFNEKKELAKGTFRALLSKSNKSEIYAARGAFDLQVK